MRRGLRLYLATATCARLADDGMAVAVTLLALHRTGSAAQGAAVLAAWMAPHAVAAPLTGALAARARGTGAAFHAAALCVFAAAIAGVALTLGRAPVPVVLAVAALGGCCGPMVTGGLSSVLAALVPSTEARARAYGLDAATYNAAGIAAPAAVTAVAGLWGTGPATAALAASAAAAAALATTLRPPRSGEDRGPGGDGSAAEPGRRLRARGEGPRPGEDPAAQPGLGGRDAVPRRRWRVRVRGGGGGGGRRSREGSAARAGVVRRGGASRGRRLWGELGDGVGALWRIPALRAITGATSLAFVGIGGLAPAAVLLADERGYPGGGGVLLTVLAAGALAGALAAARRPPGLSDVRLAAACLVGTGAALLGAAAAAPFAVCVVLFAVAGLCDGPLLAATLRIRADHAPPAVRTQVFTLGAGAKTTAGAAGAALTAAAASALSPAQLVAAIAALQLAGATLLRGALRSVPRPS